MKCTTSTATAAAAACALAAASSAPVAAAGFAFAPTTSTPSRTTSYGTSLRMGLFDGVKEAFSAPALEKSKIDSERETPIDRWMGWSVKSEDKKVADSEAQSNFVDSMDASNYVTVSLTKPMGIVFEENDDKYGGIFVFELKEGGAAESDGSIKRGDQLVAVGTKKVSGMAFDDALGTIVDDDAEETKLVLFRGSEEDLYGPTGASQAWLEEFIASGGVAA